MTTSPDRAAPSLGGSDRGGLRRSVELFRAFRVEQTDPDHFYRIQAADTVDQLRRWTPRRRTARRGRGRRRRVLHRGPGGGRSPLPPGRARGRCTGRRRARRDDGARDARPAPTTRRARPGASAIAVAVVPGRLAPGAHRGRRRQPPPAHRRRRRRGVLLQRARARPRPGPVPRRDDPGHAPRRDHLPVLHGVVLALGRSRDRSLALPGRSPGRPPLRAAATAGPRGTGSGRRSSPATWDPTLRMARAHRGVEVVAALPRYYPDWMRWLIEVPALRELVDVEPPARAAPHARPARDFSGSASTSAPSPSPVAVATIPPGRARGDRGADPVAALPTTPHPAVVDLARRHHALGLRDQAGDRPRTARPPSRRGRLLLPLRRQPPRRGTRLHRPLALPAHHPTTSSRSPTGPRCSCSCWRPRRSSASSRSSRTGCGVASSAPPR